jgi:hypothetical protein
MLGLAFADSLSGWAVTKNGIVEKQIGNPLAVGVRAPVTAQELTLGAAWPNPAAVNNDGVMIPFTTARAGELTLTLHNSAGKELGTLAEGLFEAGEHSTSWDHRGFSNGVYFITLRSGIHAVTRRIVIAR